MQSQLDVEDKQYLLLPRPWLEADPSAVREEGSMQLYSCGGQVFLKGRVGRTDLPYWHRAIAAPEVLRATRSVRGRFVPVTPM